MDTRDIYKLIREFEEERDDVINLYDSMDIELSEDFVIETGVVGFTEDGVIVHLDEDAMEFLDFNGVLLESENLNEDEDSSSDAVYSAVVNRIMRQHPEVLSKFGPEAVMTAVDDLAHDVGSEGLEEIGSSDVSIWTNQVIKDLEDGMYKHLHEGDYTSVDSFKAKLSKSNDPFEMIYGAISGDYGEEIRNEFQEMYDDIVNDSGYRLHPDDDFEKIINTIVDQYVDDGDHMYEEIATIKKLALGEAVGDITVKSKSSADAYAQHTGNDKKKTSVPKDPETGKTLYQKTTGQDGKKTSVPKDPATGKTLYQKITSEEEIDEAEYQGRKVPLGKPMKGDVKKSKVYVKKPNGKVVKVNFGDKNMRIKKSNPGRRKSFRARHNCDNPGPRWKARYWSCRAW